MQNVQAHRDYGFMAIVALVAINAVWLSLMPWVPSIASATMHRFHLRSSSFAVWAIQFPIPSMYNLANRVEVSEIPAGMLDPIIEVNEKRYINHFPFRVLTFANTRYRYLHDGKDRWVTMDSSYRGQAIETRLHARPNGDGSFTVVRLPSESSK